MSAVFADTSYFVALLNPKDAYHTVARARTQSVVPALVTTEWVLVELANYLCRVENRRLFIDLVEDLQRHPQVTIIPASSELFAQGVARYRDRPDKDWSLTDCISFLVMEHEGLTAALTVDHHFEQAGFSVLLK
jgi:predicted nucleic acid-binding protein